MITRLFFHPDIELMFSCVDLCKYTRLIQNFWNWHSASTYRFAAKCLAIATIWCFFPYKGQCFWLVRRV